jgi:hypothetical protein
MYKKYLFLTFSFALIFFTSINNSIAHEIDCPRTQEDYPKVTGWARNLKSFEDQMHIKNAKALPPAQQLQAAQNYEKTGQMICFHYCEALINNKTAPARLRNSAILLSAEQVINSMRNFCENRQINIRNILNENIRCLRFVINNDKTAEDQKSEALCVLAHYYDPGLNTIFSDPKECERLSLEALTYKLNPVNKFVALNNLAALYQNRHLGQGEEGDKTAFLFYDKIDQDETIPIERRLTTKFQKMHHLSSTYTCKEKLQERQVLVQSVLEHPEATPSLKKQAQLYAATLKFEEYTLNRHHFVKKRPEEFGALITELDNLQKDLSVFDEEQIQLLKVRYATLLHELKYLYRLDLKTMGIVHTNLEGILKDLILQDPPPIMSLWVVAVDCAMKIMYRTRDKNMNWLGKNKMSDIINRALEHKAIDPALKNGIKGSKACLVAKGLLPNTAKRDNLKELQEFLFDVSFPKDYKLYYLQVISQETHKRFPNYNKEIEKIIGYMKKTLEEETDPSFLVQIKFILYAYFQAYKECALTTEEVAQYVKDLSSEDTPEEFRIHITTDDDSEDEANLKQEMEIESTMTDSHFTVQAEIPSLDDIQKSQEQAHIETTLPESTTTASSTTTMAPIPPTTIVTQVTNTQQIRNIYHAQLLLDRLNASRGKVTQKEVTNLLRRLDYTFQPTADNGLTLHLDHKGRKNKKGTPGRLDGGHKNDLAKVLQDAIQKRSNQ